LQIVLWPKPSAQPLLGHKTYHRPSTNRHSHRFSSRYVPNLVRHFLPGTCVCGGNAFTLGVGKAARARRCWGSPRPTITRSRPCSFLPRLWRQILPVGFPTVVWKAIVRVPPLPCAAAVVKTASCWMAGHKKLVVVQGYRSPLPVRQIHGQSIPPMRLGKLRAGSGLLLIFFRQIGLFAPVTLVFGCSRNVCVTGAGHG